MTWTTNRRNCFTIYTHPEINRQVIVDNKKLTITWGDKEFNSVDEAKKFAERTLIKTEYPT